jgi:hypothetical protein
MLLSALSGSGGRLLGVPGEKGFDLRYAETSRLSMGVDSRTGFIATTLRDSTRELLGMRGEQW